METLHILLIGFYENLNFPEIILPNSLLPRFIVERKKSFQILVKGLPEKRIFQARGKIRLENLSQDEGEIEGL